MEFVGAVVYTSGIHSPSSIVFIPQFFNFFFLQAKIVANNFEKYVELTPSPAFHLSSKTLCEKLVDATKNLSSDFH